jgi:CBS domain-containing protein
MSPMLTKSNIRSSDHLPSADPMDYEVRDLMTPGVVTIVEDASLVQTYRALAAHRVHAVLVLGANIGKPLGWVTDHGLLAWIDRDPSLAVARDAITEAPTTISPSATARDALVALSQPMTQQLLVTSSPDRLPEGVVTALDLIAAGGR